MSKEPGLPPTKRGQYVSDAIRWSRLRRTTRLKPTVSTFGWKGKLVLSAPPILVFAFWAYGGVFNLGVTAIGFGLPMLWAIAWWLKQVWVAGPVDRSRAEVQSAAELLPSLPLRPDPTTAHPGLRYLYADPPQRGAAADATGPLDERQMPGD